MIINARGELGVFTHIIDKKTGEDLTKKHAFRWWQTRRKKGEYILQDMEGRPIWYSETGDYEVVRARFPNAKTVIECSANSLGFILHCLPENREEQDIEIKLINPLTK